MFTLDSDCCCQLCAQGGQFLHTSLPRAAPPVHTRPQLDQLVSDCDLGQATKSLQQSFPWAELGSKHLSETNFRNIDWHVESNFTYCNGPARNTTAWQRPFCALTPKLGPNSLGATHCLLTLPHSFHLLGQASKANECKGNPPAAWASCARARHQSTHFGMRATAWLIHVLKNTAFTSLKFRLKVLPRLLRNEWENSMVTNFLHLLKRLENCLVISLRFPWWCSRRSDEETRDIVFIQKPGKKNMKLRTKQNMTYWVHSISDFKIHSLLFWQSCRAVMQKSLRRWRLWCWFWIWPHHGLRRGGICSLRFK